jgi:ABC-type transport system involved in cytochrome bd biosynthesis fused ATPase/permease subunit
LDNALLPASNWVASIMNADSVLAWMCIWLSVNLVWFFAALSLLAGKISTLARRIIRAHAARRRNSLLCIYYGVSCNFVAN